MKKKDRELIYNKYGGRCAYCGCELNGKFQVDEFLPVKRKQKLVEETDPHKRWHSKYKRIADGCHHPERFNTDNQNPSCARCNKWKSDMDIEHFRKEIGLQVERIRRDRAAFRMAEDFKLVAETNNPVVFYFETFSTFKTKERVS